jgi:hypothetical protein
MPTEDTAASQAPRGGVSGVASPDAPGTLDDETGDMEQKKSPTELLLPYRTISKFPQFGQYT